ncbi:MAG: glycolate oxidase subunit GlcF [Gammaproteobacteria bacterium]|nr:glycolate oxidase subunit GlcF [Gammaproteobacteria bacterium]MDX2462256.1 glycolate oxidase subunit GlcF [Gammaproteobacteria bacterium]
MQTKLADFIKDTVEGREADSILRKCVHCGFCTATCPTYQLLGDELDGPRGRIYLIKESLEGQPVTEKTRRHLDRCLTCRSCETTCPSGVRYGRLLEIGRGIVDARAPRPVHERALRRALRWLLPHPQRFAPLLKMGQTLRPLLPATLRRRIPERSAAGPWPDPRHPRRQLCLSGCVQSSIAPGINATAARVFDRLGVSLVPTMAAGCCGAVSHHLSAHDEALDIMRRNIDAWWPQLEQGAEAVLTGASACTAMIKEYGELLANDPQYAHKAARVSELARDLSEAVAAEDLSALGQNTGISRRVAFHSPCTLQHAQGIRGTVESILEARGHRLTQVQNPHLCCGSAGTYSILQPTLSKRLRDNKLADLQANKPEIIATANIGCLMELRTASDVPVVHWIELLDQ